MNVNSSRRILIAALVLTAVTVVAAFTDSAFGQPKGKGKGKGKGPWHDPAFVADRDTFHFLLENRKDIRRQVKNVDDGVETLTESDRPEVTKKIQEHARAMHRRVKEGRGIHLRDPLFAEIFTYYDRIQMNVEKTAKGVRVKETSRNPRAVQLIQAHAEVVSKFIANGFSEVHKNHDVPKAPAKPGR